MVNAAIAAMLDSNWSYFSAPSYMKGFFADGIIRCLLYDDFLWPHIHMLVCNAYIWAFFVRIYMCVCNKMVIYLGIKTPQSRKECKHKWQKNAHTSCSRNDYKYTWEKNARILCHNFETNGRPQLTANFKGGQSSFALLWSYFLLSQFMTKVTFEQCLSFWLLFKLVKTPRRKFSCSSHKAFFIFHIVETGSHFSSKACAFSCIN